MVKLGAGLLTLGGFGAYSYRKLKQKAETASSADEGKQEMKSKLLRRKTNNPHVEAVPACRPLIVCGPSGAGKSTLIKRLVAEHPEDFGFSVSHTTRGPRTGEQDGEDYHFTTTEDMLEMIKNGRFIEHAHVHNRIYGTSVQAVTDVMQRREICILDIDVQGVQTIMESEAHNELHPKYLFIRPLDVRVLEKRLISRATDSLDAINSRVKTASFEIEVAQKLPFDGVVVNDDLDTAYAELVNFIDRERQKCQACRESEKEKKLQRKLSLRGGKFGKKAPSTQSGSQ